MEIKFSKKDLIKIKPVGVNLTLKYEDGYLGEEEEQNIRVYPLTVGEKIEMQQLYEQLESLNKKKDRTPEEEKTLKSIGEQINLQYVVFTFNKIMSEEDKLDCEFVKQHIPNLWYSQIITAILEAEGHTKKEINEEKN